MSKVVMNAQRLQDLSRSLAFARRDLETVIAPELTTASAQSSLSMICKLLDMLTQELASDLTPGRATTKDAVASVRAALAISGQSRDRILSRNLDEQSPMVADDGDSEAALLRLLETAVGHDAAAVEPAVWQSFYALAAERLVRDAGSADATWESSYLESGAGSRSTFAQAGIGRELTATELASYLNETGRSAGLATVTRLERLPGGYSKGTYLVELEQADGPAESLVLRRDLSFTPLETRVVDEFPLLRALYAQGLPVPAPLWCEPDAGRLGAPLVALRRVGGSGDMADWAQDAASARSIALSAARLLASIHAVEPSTLPRLQADAPGCSGETPLDVLAHVEKFWQAVRIEPDPLVELVFDWLRRHAPRPGPHTLVHGDYGLHNLLVADGRVEAILDWEFAHIGDPREDLAYARPFVEKVLRWTDFLREYEAAGGISSDDDALRFYTVLGSLRNSLGCMKVLHALRHGDPGIDSKFVYVGRSYAQQLLRVAAQLTGEVDS